MQPFTAGFRKFCREYRLLAPYQSLEKKTRMTGSRPIRTPSRRRVRFCGILRRCLASRGAASEADVGSLRSEGCKGYDCNADQTGICLRALQRLHGRSLMWVNAFVRGPRNFCCRMGHPPRVFQICRCNAAVQHSGSCLKDVVRTPSKRRELWKDILVQHTPHPSLPS
jgi:hypothetical protein